MGKLKLTLKSDLCASTGQAFSSVIDSDIAVDPFGLPYIPARRIKGCLSDAAEYIGTDQKIISELFGRTGMEKSGLLKIGNGYLEHAETLKKALSGNTVFTPQRVTELFCDVKTQTALEGETAKENSLRFTRVLSHYLPYGNNSETVFVFDVYGVPEKDEKQFYRICKALRHIGLMRTRGLGFVSAEYDPEANESSTAAHRVFERNNGYYIPLHIKLKEPLLIASRNNADCLSYVPGTAVLGAFARLAVLHGPKDISFEELFLSGKVSYGNLYISDEEGRESVPAPHFLRKLKSENAERDGMIVTKYELEKNASITEQSTDPQADEPKPETPKVLKNDFVSAAELKKVLDVSTETQYHHTRSGDAGLYTQDSISAGQYLYGEVTSSDKNLLDQLAELLKTGDFRLGRSKSAQYSGCSLLEFKEHEKKVPSVEGVESEVIFTLDSDVILSDCNGINTVDPEALKEALGIQDKPAEFNLGYKIIHGYNAKRNMRNLPVVAFTMGSTVTVKEYATGERSKQIGCRTAEGFGRIRVYTKEEVISGMSGTSTQAASRKELQNETDCDETIKNSFSALLDYEIKKGEAIQKAEKCFEKNEESFAKDKLNAAFIGTVARMVETSKTETDALDKVDKIKNESKKEKIKEILRDSVCDGHPDELKLLGMQTVLRLAKYRLKLLSKEGATNE